jgi:hypothetical protein
MEQLGSHWTDFHEIWYLSIFRNSVGKIQLDYNLTRIKVILYEDSCTFLIISRSNLLKIKKHFRQKLYRKLQHSFLFKNVLPKIVSFKRYCGKIWLSQIGHRWQYNKAHAHYLWITKATDTHLEENTYCFHITTIVTRTHLIVTLIRLLPILSSTLICQLACI